MDELPLDIQKKIIYDYFDSDEYTCHICDMTLFDCKICNINNISKTPYFWLVINIFFIETNLQVTKYNFLFTILFLKKESS